MGRGKKQNQPNEMPFLDHLEEFRWRILKSLIAVLGTSIFSFLFVDQFLDLLIRPSRLMPRPPKLIFLTVTGMFMVKMNIALVSGLIVALPFVSYQFWLFVAPGLLRKERKVAIYIIGASTLCFLLGSALAYFGVAPVALKFLIEMQRPDVEPQIEIGKYITFLLKLMLAFGVIFELPVVSYFLSKLGILTPQFLKKNRRYAIVAIVIVAGVVTPGPDVFSQLMMSVPMVLLYEISIIVSKFARRKTEEA